MKTYLTLVLATLFFVQVAFAGGSISWDDVKPRLAKSDPELVKIIERSFVVNKVGGGVRLGPQFGERQGERIAPYEFGAAHRKTKAKCVLVIEESEDHEFTGRFKFTQKPEMKTSKLNIAALPTGNRSTNSTPTTVP
ncbi:MAG: hypothetical protein NTW21_13505 [Verrucomicrobia bacterium]|nr:hypothetical protein [Verrucomicrobiota bacterium]